MKYTVDNKERSEKSSKRSRSQDKKVEPLKDLKLTVKNEGLSTKKKTSPKLKPQPLPQLEWPKKVS